MTTKIQADAHLHHDEPDEFIAEKLRTEMILAERWELTDLGRQHQQERRQCIEGGPCTDPSTLTASSAARPPGTFARASTRDGRCPSRRCIRPATSWRQSPTGNVRYRPAPPASGNPA